ncbi:MAG: EAL domain-containing protein [Rhodocyclaceae bacterium]|nr:EAL domain-containing protein [Rhodocyclaceae bacterium]
MTNGAMGQARSPDFEQALVNHAVGVEEMAAIRAFARVVAAADIASEFALCLARIAQGSVMSGSEQAQAHFCRVLVDCARWAEPQPWFDRLHASWAECLDGGAAPGFSLDACAALVKAAARCLAGDRAAVPRLEMDILFAIDAFAWCAASLLARELPSRPADGASSGDVDAATGLPDRHAIGRLLGQWLPGAGEGQRVGLVVLSMEWGVAVRNLPASERDRLCVALSQRLAEELRAGDVLCASGDQEWSLLLPALRSPAQLRLAANKLIMACDMLLEDEVGERCGRLRAGGAVGPAHGHDAASLEVAARTALLVARRRSLDFEEYCDEFAEVVDETVDFERELLSALHLQELQLYLQPQVRLCDGRCVAVELLLRWQRHSGEWVAPPRIIDGAQRLGVLPRLSNWLIMHGAKVAAALVHAGVDVKVNVNLTASDVMDDELPVMVAQALDTWRVAPGRFGLEITESALVPDEQRAAKLISYLRQLGCPVALDDFGTGFSSLAYLRNLPVTELKIDQMFVRGLGQSRADQAIVEAVMRLADGFGLQVVAEGVEDARAREMLAEMGCDLVQGHLEAQAMPLGEFIGWWRAREAGRSSVPA